MLGPKERFSSRVDDYVRYRPSYPREILQLLQAECGFSANWRVADIGAGPGNLTRLFLDNGNIVYAVEPNREMRVAGEALLRQFPKFDCLPGSAEDTGLSDQCVRLITAGQAFHWFDQPLARKEFERILQPDGWVALIWNIRRIDETSFARRYEAILRTLPEYEKVKADGAPEQELLTFFSPGAMRQATFDNEQRLTFKAFLGRVLSSSYVPQAGSPGHEEIVQSLTELFESEAIHSEVCFAYDTKVYYGRLQP